MVDWWLVGLLLGDGSATCWTVDGLLLGGWLPDWQNNQRQFVSGFICTSAERAERTDRKGLQPFLSINRSQVARRTTQVKYG